MYVDTFDNIGQEKTSMKHIYQALWNLKPIKIHSLYLSIRSVPVNNNFVIYNYLCIYAISSYHH
jgi:hypothetical protein